MNHLIIIPACAGLLLITGCAMTTSTGGSYGSAYDDSAAANTQAQAQANAQFASDQANLANQTMIQQINATANQATSDAAAAAAAASVPPPPPQ